MEMKNKAPTSHCDATTRMCVAHAATIISTKWTPQLIYAVSSGVSRFSELRTEVGGVNPRTLSARLDDLEASGIIKKMAFAEVPPRIEYTLTDKGKDLLPILEQMSKWGRKYS